MSEKRARVVSLVPSWTETLLSAEVSTQLSVVGRTRFCIHPEDVVASIPALGGTKGMDLQKILQLQPDYVILDREENRKEMADQLTAAKIKILVSHVVDIASAADFLRTLAHELEAPALLDMAERYMNLKPIDAEKFKKTILLQGGQDFHFLESVQYVIWKNPFMVIGQNTFIGDVLKLGGIKIEEKRKYPEVNVDELKKSFCLFSSEPFPFAKDYPQLLKDGFKGVVVDGEKISWYGIRNLLFLESCAE